MDDEIKKCQVLAVQRFTTGESPEAICASLGKSKFWLYKWVKRHSENDPLWFEDRSRKPRSTPHRIPTEIEEVVKLVRLNLYSRDLFCAFSGN